MMSKTDDMVWLAKPPKKKNKSIWRAISANEPFNARGGQPRTVQIDEGLEIGCQQDNWTPKTRKRQNL